MSAMGQLVTITFVSLIAAGGTFLFTGPPARMFICDPATLKPGEICLQQIPLDMNVLWVDARLRKDWEKSGVTGSILWNLDPAENMQVFEAEAAMRIMESPRVIVYCGDENCGISRQIADRILGLQLSAEVSVLRGGWRALKEAKRVKGSNPAS